MEYRLRKYFEAEKKGALGILLTGIIFLSAGIILFFYLKNPTWQGFGIPIAVVSILQIIAGIYIYFKTDQQVNNLVNLLHKSPNQYIEEELARMKKVNMGFKAYKNIEMGLFLLGFTFLILGAAEKVLPFMMGLGGGLALQAAIMFIFDLFADMRAALYTSSIANFKHKPK